MLIAYRSVSVKRGGPGEKDEQNSKGGVAKAGWRGKTGSSGVELSLNEFSEVGIAI